MHRSRLNRLVLLIAAAAVPYSGFTAPADTAFFNSRRAKLYAEYSSCWGDTAAIPLDSLVEWKIGLDEWISSATYDSAYKAYVKATGIMDSVVPCELYNWIRHQHAGAARDRDDLVRLVERHNKAVDDSLTLARDLARHPSSPADFAGIPFGVTRKTFLIVFRKKFDARIMDDIASVRVEDFPWNGSLLTLAFRFDDRTRLYRYEIESSGFPPDSLDSHARILLAGLADEMASRLGEPDRSCRIGMYDIVQGRLSPYRCWSRGPYTVYSGLGVYKYRYYAKVIVEKKHADDDRDTLR